MGNLMNKTKAQLIEIIERKDAVETKLREEVKSLNNQKELLEDNNAELAQSYQQANAIAENAKKDALGSQKALIAANKARHDVEVLCENYKDEIDSLTEAVQTAEFDARLYKRLSIIGLVAIVLMAIWIAL